ncbi:hypothetical protein BVRB_031180, partial [Beta vulgaris subsp. vulgaris]
ACVTMLWTMVAVQSQQGFALVINVVAYLGVMLYTYPVRFGNLKTHLAFGTLFGATLAIMFMSGKWTFYFASHFLGAPLGYLSALYIATFCFNAGTAACALPLLCMWAFLEAKSEEGAKGREGEAYYHEDVRAAA